MTEHEREIDVFIRARYPVLYIVSFEEERVERSLRKIARLRGKELINWSITNGFSGVTAERRSRNQSALELDMALDALEHIDKWNPPSGEVDGNGAIFLLKDFDPFISAPSVERKLRDVAQSLKTTRKTIVIVSPVLKIPPHLEKVTTVIDYQLPNFEELKGIFENMVRQVQDNPNVQINLDDTSMELFVKAALGLTAEEAENVFAKALVKDGRLEKVDIHEVLSEKKQIIRKSGTLEYYETDIAFEDVGGLDLLKDWLRKRKRSFTEKARSFGLPEPRGVLLIGVQGCGKSLSAKAVASLWELPLLRFDIGSVFGKYVGESEANIRKAIQVAESVAPCVLWIDELEKGFSGMTGGEDSGTSARVLASFLTWLNEKSSPVFVTATANKVEVLPPELLRKGRLDETFFLDLPTVTERREIFDIHLRRRHRNPEEFDLDRLAQVSEGFSGSEIEQAIIGSLYDAFDQDRDITTADIERNVEVTVTISRTMKEQIASLRAWATERARPASSPAGEEPAES